ncbi:unnamed protein product [Dicrocoelium dendriticum]|nr:unnamed protein product [Dicrocoelium dendriticum]
MSTNHKATAFAFTYMICSTGIIFTNKLVLTTYAFPSFIFLAFAQTVFTFLLIQLCFSGHLQQTELRRAVFKIFPLACFYATDIVMGIAGTGSLSLPMFSALRRLSNLFILIGEHIFLGIVRTASVYGSVNAMVFGAVIAAISDITFDPIGYAYVLVNNVSTASKALLTKSRLRDQGFSSIELLYYNSGLMIPFLLLIVCVQTDLPEVFNFPEWSNPLFLLCFIFSCCSAVLLNYSLLQCTHYTSALTTSVMGVVKNVLVTYAGMFVGGDYIYTPMNFIGVTISAAGAILYVIAVYRQSRPVAEASTEGVKCSVPPTDPFAKQ